MLVRQRKRYRLRSAPLRWLGPKPRRRVPLSQGRKGVLQDRSQQARQGEQKKTRDQTQAKKMQLQTLITMLRQLSTKGEPVVLHDTNVKAKQVFITQNIHNNQHTTIKRHDKMRIDKGLFVLHFD
jgi:hypothetical protein